MLSVGGNRKSQFRKLGFSLLEVVVVALLISVALLAVSQTMTLIVVRSLSSTELARREDQGARFVSSITLATKTASAWGIYPDLNSYTSGPQTNMAPQGDVLVCDSTTASGVPILYVFVYDRSSQTLKRFENNMNTERMALKDVSPTASATVFGQDLGLVQGHWQMRVQNQLIAFSAYGTPPRMR
jgi:prepilin-type N-terminal cleavage/methylation domain-containing protein